MSNLHNTLSTLLTLSPAMDRSEPPPPPELSFPVEQLINQICREQNQPPLQPNVRWELSLLDEEEALYILRSIASSRINKTFDAFVMYMINKSKTRNRCSPSPSPDQPIRSPTATSPFTPTRLMMPQQCESDFSSPVRRQLNWPEISPEMEAFGELEFRKSFLILSYLGGQKLEKFLSVDRIQGFINMSMEIFEADVWRLVGSRCGYIKEHERVKYVSWDSGKTHMYNCHVYPEGYYRFKGPYLVVKSNLLQRTLGDDNILMVKIAEDTNERKSTCRIDDFYAKYGWLAREGILVGLHLYRFFWSRILFCKGMSCVLIHLTSMEWITNIF